MFYEGTIKVTKMDEKGIDKEVKESFIVENVELFGEVEQKLLELYNGECEVIAIKRANIMEIVNQPSEDSKIFKAKIVSIFVDEKTEKEKEQPYHVLIWAHDMDDANRKMQNYLAQGMQDLLLKEIKETKLIDVI